MRCGWRFEPQVHPMDDQRRAMLTDDPTYTRPVDRDVIVRPPNAATSREVARRLRWRCWSASEVVVGLVRAGCAPRRGSTARSVMPTRGRPCGRGSCARRPGPRSSSGPEHREWSPRDTRLFQSAAIWASARTALPRLACTAGRARPGRSCGASRHHLAAFVDLGHDANGLVGAVRGDGAALHPSGRSARSRRRGRRLDRPSRGPTTMPVRRLSPDVAAGRSRPPRAGAAGPSRRARLRSTTTSRARPGRR